MRRHEDGFRFLGVFAMILVATAFSASAGTVYLFSENRPPEHPSGAGSRTFAKLVREAGDGRVDVEIKDGGALYGELGALEAVRRGDAAFCRVGADLVAHFAPALGVLSMPYLFRDGEHLWGVLSGPIGRELLEEAKEGGVVGLAFFDAGARGYYNARRDVRSPNHMRGLKIRVPQSQAAVAAVSALGATPSPMFESDVASSLSLGLVDGADGSAPEYRDSGHWKRAGYYTRDNHTRTPDILCVSRSVWEAMSAEDRKIVADAAAAAGAEQRAAWREYEKKALEDLYAEGGVIIADVAYPEEWREAVRPAYSVVHLGAKGDAFLKRIREYKP